MTHSCYSKTNLDILWVKSVGSVQAFQDPVVFLVCLSGKQFCFVLWRSPFQHTVQFLPPQGPKPALPFSSFRALKNAECHLAVAKAASGGWRFILIHARLRRSSSVTIYKLCMWTIIMSGSAHLTPCTCSKAELCLGHMDPVPRFQPWTEGKFC